MLLRLARLRVAPALRGAHARRAHSVHPALSASAPASAAEPAASWAASFSPIDGAQHLLEFAHDSAGLPWWATIVAGTVVARACVLPAVIYQHRQMARFGHLRPLLRAVAESCKHIAARPTRQMATLSGMWQVCVANGVHPLSLFAGAFVQLPVFFVCIFAVRRLITSHTPAASAALDSPAAAAEALGGGSAGAVGGGLVEGGTLWFTDLTAMDPTAVLPMLTLATFIATTELANRGREKTGAAPDDSAAATGASSTGSVVRASKPPPVPAWLDMLRKRMQDLGVIALPAVATFPAGLFAFWLTSNLLALAQGALLKSDAARQSGWLSPPAPAHLRPATTEGGVGIRESARAVAMGQARALELRGEKQAAAEAYRHLVLKQPEDLDAALALSRLLLASESAEGYAMAVAVLRPFVAANPTERRAPLALAQALARVGEGAEAEAVVRAALAAEPANVQARIALASFLAAAPAAVPAQTGAQSAARAGAGPSRLAQAADELARAALESRRVGDETAATWCEREEKKLRGAKGV